MNEFRPAVGIEFDNKYINAKYKLVEFVKVINELTPMQREKLAKEFMASLGMSTSLEQFINYMDNGGIR